MRGTVVTIGMAGARAGSKIAAMFTGLVEGLGTIAEVVAEGPGTRLVVAPQPPLLERTSPGDSVAINGCCLTIVAAQLGRWAFQAGPETLSRTNLGLLLPGDR